MNKILFPTEKKLKTEVKELRKPGYEVSDPNATYADIPASIRQQISDQLMAGIPDTVIRKGM